MSAAGRRLQPLLLTMHCSVINRPDSCARVSDKQMEKSAGHVTGQVYPRPEWQPESLPGNEDA